MVDIETLAEKCVLDGKGLKKFVEPSDIRVEKLQPSLRFTIEEEFKIHELEAMRESLLDGIFRIYLRFPNFLEFVSKPFSALSQGEELELSRQPILAFHKNFRYFLSHEMDYGGIFRHLLDSSFYIFKDIPGEVRKELLPITLGVMDICNR